MMAPVKALVLLFLVLAVGCGNSGPDAASGKAIEPAAFLGTWSFEDAPTANNPVRSASITVESSSDGKLEVRGTLGTALLECSVTGEGDLRGGSLLVNLECTSESASWTAAAKFEVVSGTRLHAEVPDRFGDVWKFDLVKN